MSNYLFLSTGDPRLDSLVGNDGCGFKYHTEFPLKLLIKGHPGTGKSFLATQFAVNFPLSQPKSNKRYAVYYTLDEASPIITRRIKKFQKDNDIAIINLDTKLKKNKNIPLESESRRLNDQCSIIVREICLPLSEIPELGKELLDGGSLSSLLDLSRLVPWHRIGNLGRQIRGDINAIREVSKNAEIFIIIDSINAILETKTDFILRSTLRSLIEGFATDANRCCFLFIAEGNTSDLTEDYLVDCIIHTESDKEKGERYLTVSKARGHEIRPARHKVLIDDSGMRIVPQTTYLKLSQKLKAPPKPLDRCKFGIKFFDDSLCLPSVVENRGGDSSLGVPRGSTSIITGPPGTCKTLIGLQFLRAGAEVNEPGLILSFSPQKSGLITIYRDFLQDNNQIQFYPLEITSLIEEIEDKILKLAIEKAQKPKRVTISDLGELSLRFGHEQTLKMFIRLKETFRAVDITSIFVISRVHRDPQFNQTGGSFELLADNLITTSIVGDHGPGRKATALCLRMYSGYSRPPEFIEHSYNPKDRKIVLSKDFLVDVIESKTGELTLGELRAYYFVGETKALNDFSEYQRDLLTENYPGSEDERPNVILYGQEARRESLLHAATDTSRKSIRRENLLQSLAFHPAFSRRKRSEVLMFDQPWAQVLCNTLIPLDKMLTKSEINEFNKLPAKVQSVFRSSDGKILGLPYYHNFLTLCYRRDLLAKPVEYEASLHPFVTEEGTISNQKNLTWLTIFRIADIASEYHRKVTNKTCVPFSYDADSSECLSSMLISLVGGPKKRLNFSNHSEIIRRWLSCAASNQIVASNMLDTSKLFSKGQDVSSIPNLKIEPIFSWCWYASILAMRKLHGTDNVCCLDTSLAVPISGSWALGILDGSLNPRRALAMIRLLRSEESQHQMSVCGAAVPANNKIWSDRWFPKVDQMILKKARCRSAIQDYASCRRSISQAMNDLLEPITSQIINQGWGVPSRIQMSEVESSLKHLDKDLRGIWSLGDK